MQRSDAPVRYFVPFFCIITSMDRTWRLVAAILLLLITGCSLTGQPEPALLPSPDPSLQPSASSQASATPTPTIEPLPVAPGDIWLVNETDHALLCFDSQTLAQKAAIGIEGGLSALIQGEYGIWAIGSNGQELLKIDPVQRSIISRKKLDGYTLHALAASPESVWLGVQPDPLPEPAVPGASPGGGLVLLDAQSLETVVFVDLGAPATDVEVYGGWVGAVSTWNGISSVFIIDPVTYSTFQPDQGSLWYGTTRIAVNNAGIWVVNSVTPAALALLPVTTGSNQVLVPLEGMRGNAFDVQATSSGVWIVSDLGEIVKIDPVEQKVKAVFPVSRSEASLTATEEMVWLVSQWDGMIYAISPDQERVMVMVTTGNRKPTPTLTPTITPYPTEAQLPNCSAGFNTRLKVGARAIVESESAMPNRIREEAGLEGKVLGFIQQYETVMVLAGPVCRDNWVWWKVRSEQSYIVGWTAEGDEETYWLQPLE